MRRRTLKRLERWIQVLGEGFTPLLASAGGGAPLDPFAERPAPKAPPPAPEPGPGSSAPAGDLARPSDEGLRAPQPRDAPSGPARSSSAPAGAVPSGSAPSSTASAGTASSGKVPSGKVPSGSSPAGSAASAAGEPPPPGRHRRLAGKVKKGLISVVASSYDARADDLEERAVRAMRKALVDERSHILEVAREMYDARADDLQTRAVATLRRLFEDEHQRMLEFVQRSYDSRADDLEERAVRAMRSAVQREADRIESLIEHSVHVKRREVRLSLLVLVVANLIYLLVYWLTGAGR
jgi:hypothetical protein